MEIITLIITISILAIFFVLYLICLKISSISSDIKIIYERMYKLSGFVQQEMHKTSQIEGYVKELKSEIKYLMNEDSSEI